MFQFQSVPPQRANRDGTDVREARRAAIYARRTVVVPPPGQIGAVGAPADG